LNELYSDNSLDGDTIDTTEKGCNWRTIGRGWFWLGVCAVVMAFSGSDAYAGQLGNAFTWRSIAPLALSAADINNPTIIRSNYINVNFALFEQQADIGPAGNVVTLNLFPDVIIQATLERLERRSPANFTWAGRVPNFPDSSVILTFVNGSLAANINVNGKEFEIKGTGIGIHVIHEIDQSAFPQEAPPLPIGIPLSIQPDFPVAPDSAALVDVMVVYTPAAESAAGGAAPMAAKIQLAIDESNTGYLHSQVTQRLRLVHFQKVTYTEANPVNAHTDLNNLTGSTDGFMDNVHTLRNTYGADEVVLLTDWVGSSCGLAWINDPVSPSFENHAFATVDQSCATGYYSFGHELGHNMGARHDVFVDTSTTPYPYAHGFVHLGTSITSAWRTIMAYYSACNASGWYCYRKLYWSNPNANYTDGNPMGNTTADNHRTLNNTALTTANFRQSVSALVCIKSGYVPKVTVKPGMSNSTIYLRTSSLASSYKTFTTTDTKLIKAAVKSLPGRTYVKIKGNADCTTATSGGAAQYVIVAP